MVGVESIVWFAVVLVLVIGAFSVVGLRVNLVLGPAIVLASGIGSRCYIGQSVVDPPIPLGFHATNTEDMHIDIYDSFESNNHCCPVCILSYVSLSCVPWKSVTHRPVSGFFCERGWLRRG